MTQPTNGAQHPAAAPELPGADAEPTTPSGDAQRPARADSAPAAGRLDESVLVGTDDQPGILDRFEVTATLMEAGNTMVLWHCRRQHDYGRGHVGVIARNLEGSQEGLTLGELAEAALKHEREDHDLAAADEFEVRATPATDAKVEGLVARLARVEAERDAMLPVVEAAVAWRDAVPGGRMDLDAANVLHSAVNEYTAARAGLVEVPPTPTTDAEFEALPRIDLAEVPAGPLDLDAIRARCEAATSGSWTTGAGHEPGWKPHELIIAPTYPLIELDDSEQGRADAEFIAHARTDVPMLLAEVERLAARLAEYAPDRPGSPTYDMLAKAFGDLIDERSEWERVVREMGADIERLTGALAEMTGHRDATQVEYDDMRSQRDGYREALRVLGERLEEAGRTLAEVRGTSQQSIDARDRLLHEATAERDRYRDLAERTEQEHRRLEAERADAIRDFVHANDRAGELETELELMRHSRDRYRAVVERVRQVTGKWHQTTNDDPWATIGLVSAAGEILNALSAAEPSGVDSGTGEAGSAVHGAHGGADGAVVCEPKHPTDPRPFEDLRSTGLLWLINAAAFHPRGFALALCYDAGILAGWRLLGDGSEPWRFEGDAIDQHFTDVEALFAAHRHSSGIERGESASPEPRTIDLSRVRGYMWTDPDGTQRMIPPDEIGVLVADEAPEPSKPRVIAWDWKQQIPLDELCAALDAGLVHLHEVDTGSDECAIVLASAPMGPAAVHAAYEHRDENYDATGETPADGAVSVSSEGRQLEWHETEDGPVLVPPAGEYQITCGVHGILSQRYATDLDGYGAALRKAESHRKRCIGTVGVEFVPDEATDA